MFSFSKTYFSSFRNLFKALIFSFYSRSSSSENYECWYLNPVILDLEVLQTPYLWDYSWSRFEMLPIGDRSNRLSSSLDSLSSILELSYLDNAGFGKFSNILLFYFLSVLFKLSHILTRFWSFIIVLINEAVSWSSSSPFLLRY